jgi:hypothetical protein
VIPGATPLAAALGALSYGLDGSTFDDVGRDLGQLATAVRGAVPSYCGLSITMVVDGIAVTVTTPESDDGALTADVVTSLAFPLPSVSVTACGELVLFASVAGAFVDLAADLAYATSAAAAVFELDAHLDQPTSGVPVGMAGFSMVNQAVGALMERGYTPDHARAHITRNATDAGHDLATAAADIVAAVER